MFKGVPEVAWRYVFLTGLIPAAFAFIVRAFVKEPERWKSAAEGAHAKISELFGANNVKITLSGLAMAAVSLIMWWSCNAFIPVVAGGLARAASTPELAEVFKRTATNSFNVGGLLGTLLTVPASKVLGRKWMFGIYFVGSAASIMAAFGLDVPPETRLYFYFPIGVFVFGVFGSFTYYLPELFPTRYRGTGAGFCYNIGRLIAAAGPILVGQLAKNLDAAMRALFWVGVVPLLALVVLPYVIETKGRALAD